MQIILKAKHVYGNKLLYPACDKSEIFAALIKKKTLDDSDIAKIKLLGFEVLITGEV